MKKIFLVAGGTGGHLFPAIATGEELLKRGYEVHLITDQRCWKYLSPELKLQAHMIYLPRAKGLAGKLFFIYGILAAICKSLMLIKKINPLILIGFGGYPSFPPLFAGVIAGKPLIIHEQNCFIGKSNRMFQRFAKIIGLSFGDTSNISQKYAHKIIVTGSIVRENILNLPPKENFDNEFLRILVFGGSQGAKIFTTIIPEAITILKRDNPDVNIQITQQVPVAQQPEVQKIYDSLKIQYQLAEFFFNMDFQYQNAELVISRAGASTIAELTSIGLPAIFIPLAHSAENHQYFNAKAIENAKGSWCYEQATLTPQILASKILELYRNRDILKSASAKLLERKKNGSQILADTIEKIIS